MILYGVDLGGTKIEGAVVDSACPDQALYRKRMPTEADRGYAHVIGQIERLVAGMERETGVLRPCRIGFGTPGTADPKTGRLKNSNSSCLNQHNLRDDLSRVLGAEIRISNDANCFALAEALHGSGRGKRVVIGMILGTGVGAGIVVDGRAIEGLHGIAGEWGHNPICGETAPCYCGRKGCVETVIAGPALERYYGALTGTSVTLSEIANRTRAGDRAASDALNRLSTQFAVAAAAVINVIDPDAIVIGGGVGNIDILYSIQTRDAIQRHLFNGELRTEILRPTLGDSAGVFGAAMLCI
jgi:predicted NBD/HSP70 family sugar kinase